MDRGLGKLHSVLLALLRSGLWEKEIDDLSDFPLSAGEWGSVLRLSRQQTVTGLVFEGLQHLPDDMLPPEPVLIRWTAEVDAIERMNLKMNRSLSQLYDLFRSHGFDPVLQKGQGVAQFYAKPLLRECGDIDFYFESGEAFAGAAGIVRSCGMQVRNMPDKSLFYVWNGTEVEHHVRLFDLHNPFLQRYLGTLERRKGYAQLPLLPRHDLSVTVPSPFLNLLMLNLHILKHALGWGIGLRQLCDMARACYKLHQSIDTVEMEQVCGRLGLKRWSPLLHSFMTVHLGLPASCLPYPATAADARPLLDIVWRGGNFGYVLTTRKSSGRSVWRRKLRTAGAFRDNLRFAARYAPRETFWIVADLMKGQF